MLANMNFWQVNVLLEKDLLEKSSTIKIFQYTPLNKELKLKNDIWQNYNFKD